MRPRNDQGWKVFFPDHMDTKKGPQSERETKGFKCAKLKRPDSNPMWAAGYHDKTIFTSVRSLIDTIGQEPAKLATERRHEDLCKRALACSSIPVVRPSQNKLRDWTPVSCWAFLEVIFVKGYRSDLLSSIAGHIRLKLQNGLASFVVSDSQTRLGPSGSLTVNSSFPWPDGLVVTTHSLVPSAVNVDISDMERTKRCRIMTESHHKGIQRLINIWETSELSLNDAGPRGTVDSDISKALDMLILVSFLFPLIITLLSFRPLSGMCRGIGSELYLTVTTLCRLSTLGMWNMVHTNVLRFLSTQIPQCDFSFFLSFFPLFFSFIFYQQLIVPDDIDLGNGVGAVELELASKDVPIDQDISMHQDVTEQLDLPMVMEANVAKASMSLGMCFTAPLCLFH